MEACKEEIYFHCHILLVKTVSMLVSTALQVCFSIIAAWGRAWGTSLAESHIRQEMFSLTDACRIAAGAQTHHNIRDTVPNKQANVPVE